MSPYACARDLFDACRSAAQDAERLSRTLARMEAREGVRAQSYESHGRSGHRSDAMSATDRRMDWEGRVRERRKADYGLIDLACKVIYGDDQLGSGGVAALLGTRQADVVWWRCCGLASWGEIADKLGISERQAQYDYDAACDVVDGLGLWCVTHGLGLATS